MTLFVVMWVGQRLPKFGGSTDHNFHPSFILLFVFSCLQPLTSLSAPVSYLSLFVQFPSASDFRFYFFWVRPSNDRLRLDSSGPIGSCETTSQSIKGINRSIIELRRRWSDGTANTPRSEKCGFDSRHIYSVCFISPSGRVS